MKSIETFTPVLVLRSTYHGGLGIVRSLGRLGVPVYVLDVNPATPAIYSRYCSGAFCWDLDNSPPERSVAFLKSIARQLQISPILMPTTDTAVLFVEQHAVELRPWFTFPVRPAGLAQQLSDKRDMYHLALKEGIPTPRTCFPVSEQDALHFAARVGFPIIVKDIRTLSIQSLAPPRGKLITWTKTELSATFRSLDQGTGANLLLQEFIPGGEESNWMFNGYFDEQSNCLFGITGRKIRQYPPYAGVASLGVTQPNPEVDLLARRFMKAVGYRGMLDCGFRYDMRDGQYKIFDVNPRVGSTFRLFVSDNGTDVVRAAYLDLTNQQFDPGNPVWQRKWTVEDLDLGAAFRYRQDGNLNLNEWFRSYWGVRETAFVHLGDLLPAIAVGRTRLQYLWRALVEREQKFRKRLTLWSSPSKLPYSEESEAPRTENTISP